MSTNPMPLPEASTTGRSSMRISSKTFTISAAYDVTGIDRGDTVMYCDTGADRIDDESPEADGLGILKGEILRIPDAEGLKIPHMGWNSLHLQNGGRLFQGLKENDYVYFVHSYYLKAEDEEIVKATTNYSVNIHASVEKDNVFACQFHPEKSSDVGLQILKNFVEL